MKSWFWNGNQKDTTQNSTKHQTHYIAISPCSTGITLDAIFLHCILEEHKMCCFDHEGKTIALQHGRVKATSCVLWSERFDGNSAVNQSRTILAWDFLLQEVKWELFIGSFCLFPFFENYCNGIIIFVGVTWVFLHKQVNKETEGVLDTENLQVQ